jgi:hypothetical protein
MRCEIFTAMKIWIVVFWVMTPCRLVDVYKPFLDNFAPIFRVEVMWVIWKGRITNGNGETGGS